MGIALNHLSTKDLCMNPYFFKKIEKHGYPLPTLSTKYRTQSSKHLKIKIITRNWATEAIKKWQMPISPNPY